MSRRDAAATAGHTARHARNRLHATLGSGSRGPLLTDGRGEAFQYDGGTSGGGQETGHEASSQSGLAGKAGMGPALRWRLGLRVALFVGVVAVLAGGWFCWQVAAARPDVVPLSDVTQSEGAPTVPAAADSSGPVHSQPGGSAPAVLHMAGAVLTPGIVELPSGSRVHEAIAAAGGSSAEADLDRLNLASVVADGQKIYVPRHGEPLPAGSSTGSSGGGAGADAAGAAGAAGAAPNGEKTNLNTAGVDELAALPKVGPVLAQRIVDWRKEHGPFKTVEELDAVDGVGPKMLETLLPLVSV